MAADLRDLRAKITPRIWCFLESESRATGKDISEIVREILGDWAEVRLHAHIEAQKLLTAEGEAAALRGKSGNDQF